MVWNVTNRIRWFFSEGSQPVQDLVPIEADQSMDFSAGDLVVRGPEIKRGRLDVEPH